MYPPSSCQPCCKFPQGTSSPNLSTPQHQLRCENPPVEGGQRCLGLRFSGSHMWNHFPPLESYLRLQYR